MASLGVTLSYTTVALHVVAAEARAQKQKVRHGAAGPGWRGGTAVEPWRPAWRLRTCSALAAMAKACPNWSRSTRVVSAVSSRESSACACGEVLAPRRRRGFSMLESVV